MAEVQIRQLMMMVRGVKVKRERVFPVESTLSVTIRFSRMSILLQWLFASNDQF